MALQIYGAPLSPQGSRLSRVVRRFVRRRRERREDAQAGRVSINLRAPVLVYFGDSVSKLYQLDQWLPALDALNQHCGVILVVRNSASARALARRTRLAVVYLRSVRQLTDFYRANTIKVALYVNHGRSNFQSLLATDTLHVHLNHGESDKRSSFSNQARAYHRVFVAGEHGNRRYVESLLEFDDSRIVRVGRPQLDTFFAPELPASPRRTVMYAPTWEGDTEDNNFTSLDRYGVAVVSALLALTDVRVVYKPHPRLIDSDRAPRPSASGHFGVVERGQQA
ncbi:MAG: hypothetical protein IPL43_01195 [Micropruina sp.]|nr:hypothetical protein [Micropruina sp.]